VKKNLPGIYRRASSFFTNIHLRNAREIEYMLGYSVLRKSYVRISNEDLVLYGSF